MSHNRVPPIIWVALGSLVTAAILCFGFAFWLAGHGFSRPFPAPKAPISTPQPSPTQPLITTPEPPTPTYPPITEFEEHPAPPSPSTVISPTQAPKAPPPPATPNWITNATQAPPIQGPQIALVIDDMGLDPEGTQQAETILPAAVTLAYMPYVEGNRLAAIRAKEAGHEILIHLPMQPRPNPAKPELNPGPNTLETTDSPEALKAKIAENLASLADLAIGVNNHMGSAFTSNEPGMAVLLAELQKNGLMFLDSVTVGRPATAAAAKAVSASLPILKRQVFLDDDPSPEAILTQFQRAVSLAKKQGNVIVIGHPHPETLKVLKANLPTLEAQGIHLVPLSALIKP